MNSCEFRCGIDGWRFVPWCTCGWAGRFEVSYLYAGWQWMDHESGECPVPAPEQSHTEEGKTDGD